MHANIFKSHGPSFSAGLHILLANTCLSFCPPPPGLDNACAQTNEFVCHDILPVSNSTYLAKKNIE